MSTLKVNGKHGSQSDTAPEGSRVSKVSHTLSCGGVIASTIMAYLLFNAVIGRSSLLVLGIITVGTGAATAVLFHKELFDRNGNNSLRLRTPDWKAVLMGSIGVMLINVGLKFAQERLGLVVCMQYVYDAFVVTYATTDFVGRFRRHEGVPGFLPVNMVLHAIMATIVGLHIYVHWHWTASEFLYASQFVWIAVCGYWLFNKSLSSIRDPQARRVTNVSTSFGSGLGVLLLSLVCHTVAQPNAGISIVLGVVALVVVVSSLGRAYQLFRPAGLEYLVPVLVYDGLLIAPSVVQILSNIHSSVLLADLWLTFCMVAVMCLRAPPLQRRILDQWQKVHASKQCG